MTNEDLIDARDHHAAMRAIRAGDMPTLTSEEADSLLNAVTPIGWWRRYRNMTQQQLAVAIGIAQPSLAKAELGMMGLRAEVYAKAAQALGVRMEDLVG